MGIKRFFAEKMLGSEVDRLVSERLPAAVSDQINMIGWRKLTGAPTRELPMMDQARALEVAYWLWKTNPMAKWIIEVTTAFVAAKGLPFTCVNDDVKGVLTDFWEDPVNRMDIHWENFVRELGIYGEQCWPAFVAEQTGRVRLGYVDPAYVQEVFPDPHNVKIKVGLTVGSHDGSCVPRRLRVVLDDENEAFLSREGQVLRESFSDGECFFFTVNALTNEMRGTSDLYTVADHLDAYEQFIFDSAEKYAQFNAFFYDIKVEGADEKKLQEEREKYQPPKTGEAFIHNEKVTAEAVAPDLKSSDSDKAARLHRNHILGAVGIPEHWYGGGGDVNRATATEMDTPARKIIESRQEKVKNMLEMMFDFAISRAEAARYLSGVPEDELYSYEVQTPEISDKDVAKLSTMLTQTASALTAAETNGWISKEEAAKAFAFFLAFVGYEYDPEATEIVPEYADYTGKKGKKGEDGRQKTKDGE
jgi:hypothetical protein